MSEMPEEIQYASPLAPLPGYRRWWHDIPPWVWPLLALAALVACIVLLEEYRYGTRNFLKPENLLNILNANSYVGVVAIGMTFVIIAAGIDLSVGSMMAMLGVLGLLCARWIVIGPPAVEGGAATIRYEWLGVTAAFAVMILGGAAAGTISGLLVSMGRIAPFIVTLGGFAAYRSVALTMASSGEVRYPPGGTAFDWLGNHGIPIPNTNIAGPFATDSPAAEGELQHRDLPGRRRRGVGAAQPHALRALHGGDRGQRAGGALQRGAGEDDQDAGVRADRHAGGPGGDHEHQPYELDRQRLGGVDAGAGRDRGGGGGRHAAVGRPRDDRGTVIGVLIMGVIPNMMVMLGIESSLQGLVKGAVIVLAVLIQRRS